VLVEGVLEVEVIAIQTEIVNAETTETGTHKAAAADPVNEILKWAHSTLPWIL
jgi:hypothetical protein